MLSFVQFWLELVWLIFSMTKRKLSLSHSIPSSSHMTSNRSPKINYIISFFVTVVGAVTKPPSFDVLGFLLPSPLPILTEKCEEYGPPRTVERLMTQVSPSAITFCAPGKCWRKIWTLKGALSNDPILEYSNLQDIQDYYGLFPRLIVSPLGKEWVAWRNRQKNKALTPWSPIFSLDPIRCISRLHFCSSINTPPIDTVLASVYKMRWSVSFIITKCDALTHRFLTLKKNQEKHLFLPQ